MDAETAVEAAGAVTRIGESAPVLFLIVLLVILFLFFTWRLVKLFIDFVRDESTANRQTIAKSTTAIDDNTKALHKIEETLARRGRLD